MKGDPKEGYKKTELGFIPDKWDIKPLKSLFERLRRKNKENNENVLTISAQHGLVNQKEFFNKSVASDNRSNYYLIEKGEFAYNKSYSKGYPVGVIKRLDRYTKGILSPLYICFSLKQDIEVSSDYLVQYFEGGLFNDEIGLIAQEGARNHGLLNINVNDFFDLKLKLPTPSEQYKIAEILTSVDETIKSSRKVIEQTKKVKQGLLQHLLTKGIGHTKFKKTEIGEIPEEWEVRRLVDCIEIVSGQVDPKQEPFCNYILIAPNHIESDTGRILNKVTAQEQGAISGKYLFEAGDVIYSKIRPYLNKAFLSDFNGLCSADMYALKSGDLITPRYLLAIILGETFTKFANSKSMRTGIPKLNRNELGEFYFGLPPIYEQQNAVKILNTIDYELETSEYELEQLQILKKGLMQDLLTGTVGVKV